MDQRLLINGSLKVRTFPQNLRLLALLSENAGRIVSYERIGAIIWPRATPANRRHSIATTRYRLEVDAGQIGVNLGIKAVYREGLLMERPVEVQCAVVIPTDVIADHAAAAPVLPEPNARPVRCGSTGDWRSWVKNSTAQVPPRLLTHALAAA